MSNSTVRLRRTCPHPRFALLFRRWSRQTTWCPNSVRVTPISSNLLTNESIFSRRAGASQVSKPNSSRAAGAGGSSNTMLKLYTDDSPGLRVCVSFSILSFSFAYLMPTMLFFPIVTRSSSSSFPSPSSRLYSSSIFPQRSSVPSQSKQTKVLPCGA